MQANELTKAIKKLNELLPTLGAASAKGDKKKTDEFYQITKRKLKKAPAAMFVSAMQTVWTHTVEFCIKHHAKIPEALRHAIHLGSQAAQ